MDTVGFHQHTHPDNNPNPSPHTHPINLAIPTAPSPTDSMWPTITTTNIPTKTSKPCLYSIQPDCPIHPNFSSPSCHSSTGKTPGNPNNETCSLANNKLHPNQTTISHLRVTNSDNPSHLIPSKICLQNFGGWPHQQKNKMTTSNTLSTQLT